MVNLEKLAALTAALKAGNTEKAEAIANNDAAFAKRATDAPKGWVEKEGNSVPAPAKDDFYTFLTPEDVEQYSLGDIIKHREVGIFNSTGVKAWQLVYRSENSTGHPVGALTTIVVPENNDGKNVVVYPQPEDSSYINCASSYDLLQKGLAADTLAILSQGWVLNIPDHEGFNSSFTAGILEGKLTLDSIRALENSRNITGVDNNAYAVGGYSGGSVAAGWAAELQESYAPDLNIVAYSMGGFVNNLTAVIETVNGTPYVGFVPAGLMGLSGEYPQLWSVWGEESNGSNTTNLEKALSQCTLQDILTYAGQDIFTYFKSGEDILENEVVAEILKNNTLKNTTPKVPMFIYNGLSDQIVPIESVDSTVEYYCSNGGNLVYNRGQGKDHTGMSAFGLPLTFEFFANAFAGNVPSGCSFNGAEADFASQFTGSYSGFSSSNSSSNSTIGAGSGFSNSTIGAGSGFSNSTSSSNGTVTTSVSGSSGSSPRASGSSGSSARASGSSDSSARASGSGSSTAPASGSSASTQNAAAYTAPACVGLISVLFSLL